MFLHSKKIVCTDLICTRICVYPNGSLLCLTIIEYSMGITNINCIIIIRLRASLCNYIPTRLDIHLETCACTCRPKSCLASDWQCYAISFLWLYYPGYIGLWVMNVDKFYCGNQRWPMNYDLLVTGALWFAIPIYMNTHCEIRPAKIRRLPKMGSMIRGFPLPCGIKY